MNDLHCSHGPVSSLPGSFHDLPEGTMCETHEDTLAVKRIQGETDSFGAEYVCMCQACYDEYQAYVEAKRASPCYCDWCKQMKTGVAPTRDYDEGMAGPVYQVCSDCRVRATEEAEEEIDSQGYEDYPDYED